MVKGVSVTRLHALVDVSRVLSDKVGAMRFKAPVSHVYNPLEYARAPHEMYLKRCGAGTKQYLFVGMNPGPFGMAQTGVPFGDVAMVRDFLCIEAKVGRPAREHPKRPILGFGCQRSEVSGTRVWGFVRDRFGTAETFFRDAFVYNYCPLCFMEASGKNRTPDQLPREEREPLYEACDAALCSVVQVLRAKCVIAVGGFAEKRARQACADMPGVRIVTVLHPSPANPRANRGWSKEVEQALAAAGIPFAQT
jgi:single-strand selective monofunctional uracil DNA glycosylase